MGEFSYQSRTPLAGAQTDTAQRKAKAVLPDNRANPPPVQRAQEHAGGGLPEHIKDGIESLSGMRMDHVKVHYNSAKPAQLNALAYAQGHDIHLGPGQERHLPHEAWHVVQQAQGRVKPTVQMKAGVAVNDNAELEREADVMGAKALVSGSPAVQGGLVTPSTLTQAPPLHAAAAASPVQRVEKDATVKWGITHIVALANDSLFGGDNALDNELQPSNGGQLKKGDKLLIDDAPFMISRRGSNQEKESKRTEDKTGNHVYEWVRVLKVIPLNGAVRDFTGKFMYVRKETIAMREETIAQGTGQRNDITLHNIKDWEGEGIPKDLLDIAKTWKNQGLLKRTKSRGVLEIDREDMAKKDDDSEKASGRNWDQYNEGYNVATNMAAGKHAPFEQGGQWRIKAVDRHTQKLVGVLIVEKREGELYLRWLIGNPEIKGGGSVLLAAVKKILSESSASEVEVTSAYSAKTAYTKSGFKEKDQKQVLPGEEFTLILRKEDLGPQSVHEEYKEFKPEHYNYNGELSHDEPVDQSADQW